MIKLTTIIANLILIIIFSTVSNAQRYTKLYDYPDFIKERNPFKRFAWDFRSGLFRMIPYRTIMPIRFEVKQTSGYLSFVLPTFTGMKLSFPLLRPVSLRYFFRQ